MSLEIKVTGTDARGAADQAAALLEEISGREPERAAQEAPEGPRKDLATAVAIASVILSIPSAVLAALQVKDRLDRRRLRDRVEAARARLAEIDSEATLTTPQGRSVDLRRTSTDEVVDLLMRDLGS